MTDGIGGRQLGYYGDSATPPYLVSDKPIYVRFHSNANGQARGFHASFSRKYILQRHEKLHLVSLARGWMFVTFGLLQNVCLFSLLKKLGDLRGQYTIHEMLCNTFNAWIVHDFEVYGSYFRSFEDNQMYQR